MTFEHYHHTKASNPTTYPIKGRPSRAVSLRAHDSNMIDQLVLFTSLPVLVGKLTGILTDILTLVNLEFCFVDMTLCCLLYLQTGVWRQ